MQPTVEDDRLKQNVFTKDQVEKNERKKLFYIVLIFFFIYSYPNFS